MKLKYISLFFVLFSFVIGQNEFSEGPYGNNYFDIAGPFTLPDLNASLDGDINIDNVVNIQDIILVIGTILGTISLDEDQQQIADINSDSIIDILDIVQLVDRIMNPSLAGWDFETNWTGNDSYIFIHYQTSAANSSALWGSTTKEALLENSPNNVHYFFLSSRTLAESDVENMKLSFDEILTNFSEEEQNHWNSHLHFVPVRSLDLDNWLSTALNGKKALAIDTSQKIREIGYLGNPASFTGTYMHYLAHEAVYFNYEKNVFAEPEETYDEFTVFDADIYTGGWAASISNTIELPSAEMMSNYNKMEVELLRGCPDSNGNYSDAGCDDYDRIARMFACDSDGSNCKEIARWITPFDRQPHSLTDISPFIATLANGGQQTIKFQESGWPNSLLTLKLRLYHADDNEITPKEFIPIWDGTVQFNPDYGDNRPPQIFSVPENAVKIEFVAYLTGHGWGSAGCFNCAEFCNSRHDFSINGGEYEFFRPHPNASSNNYCMSLGAIEQGVIPNQYGTWGYGRAGWCPGQDVAPYITDITDYVILGEENIIDYDACRVSGASCVTPPTCGGDGYCPEIAFSSYIIISY